MHRATAPLADYLAELRDVLDRDGVEPTRREQVVAEVAAHVADTGEDPVDAFGPPGVYAAQYAPPRAAVTSAAAPARRPMGPVDLLALVLLTVVAGPVALWLAAGAVALASVVVGDALTPLQKLGAVVVAAGIAVLAYLGDRAARPQVGRVRSGVLAGVVVLVLAMVTVVLLGIVGDPANPWVVVAAAAPWLLVAGLCARTVLRPRRATPAPAQRPVEARPVAPVARASVPAQDLPGWLLVVAGFVGVLALAPLGAGIASLGGWAAEWPDTARAALVVALCLVMPAAAHRAVRPRSSWLGTVVVVLASAVGVVVAVALALTLLPMLALPGFTVDAFLTAATWLWLLGCAAVIGYGVLRR